MMPLRLERLEGRDNPEGTVTATLVGSTWTIVGDGELNSIKINPGAAAGAFILLDNAGHGTLEPTVVAGVTSPSGVENIVFSMGGSPDFVVVNDTGTAADLAGRFAFDGGDEYTRLSVSDLTVGKTVTVVNGTNTVQNSTFRDEIILTNVSVAGKVTVRNGQGNAIVQIQRDRPGFNLLGRGLLVTGGLGTGGAVVGDTHIRGDVVVRGGLPGNDGGSGLSFGTAQNSSVLAVITGNVSVECAGGGGLGLGNCDVRGNVRLDAGDGVGFFGSGSGAGPPALFRGSVAVAMRGGGVFLGTGAGGSLDILFANGVRIAKDLTVNFRDAPAKFFAFRTIVDGKTTIRTGDADDIVTIDDSSFQAFTLSTGGGDDNLSWDVRDIPTFPGSFPPLATRFNGRTKVALGTGIDTVTLGVADEPGKRVEFVGRATIEAGLGADVAHVDNISLVLGVKLTLGGFET